MEKPLNFSEYIIFFYKKEIELINKNKELRNKYLQKKIPDISQFMKLYEIDEKYHKHLISIYALSKLRLDSAIETEKAQQAVLEYTNIYFDIDALIKDNIQEIILYGKNKKLKITNPLIVSKIKDFLKESLKPPSKNSKRKFNKASHLRMELYAMALVLNHILIPAIKPNIKSNNQRYTMIYDFLSIIGHSLSNRLSSKSEIIKNIFQKKINF